MKILSTISLPLFPTSSAISRNFILRCIIYLVIDGKNVGQQEANLNSSFQKDL